MKMQQPLSKQALKKANRYVWLARIVLIIFYTLLMFMVVQNIIDLWHSDYDAIIGIFILFLFFLSSVAIISLVLCFKRAPAGIMMGLIYFLFIMAPFTITLPVYGITLTLISIILTTIGAAFLIAGYINARKLKKHKLLSHTTY